MSEKLFDCWLQQGEVDNPLCGRWIKNKKFKSTRVMHNVSEAAAKSWCRTLGYFMEEKIRLKHPDLTVCHFFTLAEND